MMKNFLFVLIAVLFVFVLNDSFAQSSDGSQDSKNQYVPPTSQNEQEKPYAPPASSGETKPPYTPPEESKIPFSVNEQIQESEPVEQIQESEPVEQIQESEPVEQIQESEPLQIDPVYIPEPTPEPVVELAVEQVVNCGPGTESVNGVCQVVQTTSQESEEGGGCLIATATYGSELSPQVQLLREIRDNQLMNTESGSAFMSAFNNIYYSFSPAIADMERESPIFKEIVKVGLTPMISSLSLMENSNSESEVLGMGLSVIALNLGMYIGLPAVVIVGIRKRI
jgi:hypothetical protein